MIAAAGDGAEDETFVNEFDPTASDRVVPLDSPRCQTAEKLELHVPDLFCCDVVTELSPYQR